MQKSGVHAEKLEKNEKPIPVSREVSISRVTVRCASSRESVVDCVCMHTRYAYPVYMYAGDPLYCIIAIHT